MQTSPFLQIKKKLTTLGDQNKEEFISCERDFLDCVRHGIAHICGYKKICLSLQKGSLTFRSVLEEILDKHDIERNGLEIKRPTIHELLLLEEQLCDEDKAELAASNIEFMQCVAFGDVHIIRDSVAPLVIFGLVPCPDNTGVVWMLCTDRCFLYPRACMKISRAYIRACLEKVDCLWNYVWEESVRAQRFIRFLGFTFDTKKFLCPATGEVFLRFEKRKS